MEFPALHFVDPRGALIEEIQRLELGIAQQVAQSGSADKAMVSQRDACVAELANHPPQFALSAAQKDVITGQAIAQALEDQERVRQQATNVAAALELAQQQGAANEKELQDQLQLCNQQADQLQAVVDQYAKSAAKAPARPRKK